MQAQHLVRASDPLSSVLAAEAWLTIPGFTRYSVSSLGRVRRDVMVYRSQPGMCAVQLKQGYPQVAVTSDAGKSITVMVHVLLMLAFVGPRPEGMHICHKDGNRANCSLDNLRYDTPLANVRDAMNHGTYAHGERIAQHRLVEAEVVEIIGLLEENQAYTTIAARYGVTPDAIFRIACGKNWKHITGGKDRRNGYANSARNLAAANAAKKAGKAQVVQRGGMDLMRGKARVWEVVWSWQDYSEAKQAWVAANPGATSEQYDAAISGILDRMGL